MDALSASAVILGGLPALLGGVSLTLFATGYPLVRLLLRHLLDNHVAALAASIALSIPVSSMLGLIALVFGLGKIGVSVVYSLGSIVIALVSARVESRRSSRWAGC